MKESREDRRESRKKEGTELKEDANKEKRTEIQERRVRAKEIMWGMENECEGKEQRLRQERKI